MLADGLTRELPRAAFVAFRDQISVVDITDRLALRQLKEVSIEDLEEVKELFEGGESKTDLVLIALHKSNGQPSAEGALS